MKSARTKKAMEVLTQHRQNLSKDGADTSTVDEQLRDLDAFVKAYEKELDDLLHQEDCGKSEDEDEVDIDKKKKKREHEESTGEDADGDAGMNDDDDDPEIPGNDDTVDSQPAKKNTFGISSRFF